MRRLALLALLALALLAMPAAASGDDGGVPAGFGSSSGGTPADWSTPGLSADTDAPDDTSSLAGDERFGPAARNEPTTGTSGGGRAALTLDSMTAVAAQEPTPEPQGPGTQQPPDPGAPQTPDPGAEPPPVDVPETPVAQAPVAGGLPVTGVEVLQLSLLGIALLLVGARLRVLALRRRHGGTAPGRYRKQVEYDEAFDFDGPISARRGGRSAIRPSTATARRREAGRPASRA